MGANLRIKSLYDAAWTVFGFQYGQAVADRDRFRAKIKRRLGQDVTSEVQRHVDAALGRLQSNSQPNPAIMKMREFYDLLTLEMAVEEIAERIDAHAAFCDLDSFLPSLRLSWRDVLPLLNGQGYMPVQNVVKFLGMVENAEQGEDGRRRELVKFLERAVKMGEPVWCDR